MKQHEIYCTLYSELSVDLSSTAVKLGFDLMQYYLLLAVTFLASSVRNLHIPGICPSIVAREKE